MLPNKTINYFTKPFRWLPKLLWEWLILSASCFKFLWTTLHNILGIIAQFDPHVVKNSLSVGSVCIYVWLRVHLRLDNYFVLSVKSLSVQSWVLKETFSCCRLKFSYLVSMGKVIEQQKEKRFKLCVASLLIIWRTIQPTFIPKCNIIRTKFNSSYRPMFKCWRSHTQKPMRKSILISDIF